MSEEIIINDVNVAECRLRVYNSDLCNGFKMDNSGFHQGHCKQNPNCYYKQLKRLQAENERWKKESIENLHYLACMTEQRNKLKLALEEIREILNKSCKQCKNEYLSEDYCSGQGDCFEIRQVINEVLDERN